VGEEVGGGVNVAVGVGGFNGTATLQARDAATRNAAAAKNRNECFSGVEPYFFMIRALPWRIIPFLAYHPALLQSQYTTSRL
jgi:hypothetical protein